jgi:hypothetical protein
MGLAQSHKQLEASRKWRKIDDFGIIRLVNGMICSHQDFVDGPAERLELLVESGGTSKVDPNFE